jgi:ABC-type glycerol-3-phosphate transport system substrate-binding protein
VSDSIKAAFKVGTIVLTIVLGLVLVLGLGACGGDDAVAPADESTTAVTEVTPTTAGETGTLVDEALVGTWEGEGGESIEFTADGRMLDNGQQPEPGMEATYTADGSTIVIMVAGIEFASSAYSIDGDVLTMADPETGEPDTLQRVAE